MLRFRSGEASALPIRALDIAARFPLLSIDRRWERQRNRLSSFPGHSTSAVYMPYSQSNGEDGQIPAAMTLLVRVTSDNARVRSGIQQLARNQDPNVPVGQVQSLDDIVSGSIADFRSTTARLR
jgi:hypothetical protein